MKVAEIEYVKTEVNEDNTKKSPDSPISDFKDYTSPFQGFIFNKQPTEFTTPAPFNHSKKNFGDGSNYYYDPVDKEVFFEPLVR